MGPDTVEDFFKHDSTHQEESRLLRSPIEVRLHIYDYISLASCIEREYIRDHCKGRYGRDRGACYCLGKREKWLDSAFPGSKTARHDAAALINLFVAAPALWSDARLLKIICFEERTIPTTRLLPTSQSLDHITTLLHHAQSQDPTPQLAIDLGFWDDDSIHDLCRVLEYIRDHELKFNLAIRARWPSSRDIGSDIANVLSHIEVYAKLEKSLKRTGRCLKARGCWLKSYVGYHACYDVTECLLPPPGTAFEMKLVGMAAMEKSCFRCKQSKQRMLPGVYEGSYSGSRQ